MVLTNAHLLSGETDTMGNTRSACEAHLHMRHGMAWYAPRSMSEEDFKVEEPQPPRFLTGYRDGVTNES